jgi:hypothetical protein
MKEIALNNKQLVLVTFLNILQLFLKENIATPSNPSLMVHDDT